MMNEEMKSMEGQEQKSETSPLDAVISKLDSYIENPKLATSETLTELRGEVEAIKADVDGEETEEPEDDGKKPGLMIMIGKSGKGYKGGE